MPSGTSVFDLEHFSQLWSYARRSGQQAFRMYDHGAPGNLRAYGQRTPPDYNLSHVRNKVAIYSGSLDRLADPSDVKWLVSQLPTSPLLWRRLDGYSHIDFVWGQTAARDIYPEIIALLQAHAVGRAPQS